MSIYSVISHENQLVSALENSLDPLFIGGGSNILFTKDVAKDIIVLNHQGISIVDESNSHVMVKIQSGASWHDLVLWSVNRGYGGLENMSLIPGKCGAAPMQNIGAYGVEIKDVFVSLEALNLKTTDRMILNHADCLFGYRESIFKNELKDKLVITNITLKLSKPGHHVLNTSYGAIEQMIHQEKISQVGIKEISDIVIKIRSSKLPDLLHFPNAGSFFKNPIVSVEQFDKIKTKYPVIPSYNIDKNNIKVPAGWLIEQCGWKGKIIGNVGTYEKQALVIVNHGATDGDEILKFSQKIQDSVKERFDIELTPEVNIY